MGCCNTRCGCMWIGAILGSLALIGFFGSVWDSYMKAKLYAEHEYELQYENQHNFNVYSEGPSEEEIRSSFLSTWILLGVSVVYATVCFMLVHGARKNIVCLHHPFMVITCLGILCQVYLLFTLSLVPVTASVLMMMLTWNIFLVVLVGSNIVNIEKGRHQFQAVPTLSSNIPYQINVKHIPYEPVLKDDPPPYKAI